MDTLSAEEFTLTSGVGILKPMSSIGLKQKDRRQVAHSLCLLDGYPDYIRLILTSRVYDIVSDTPVTPATNLSNRLDCNIMLKREDLQPTFSPELRGAYNKIIHLDPRYKWKGIVAYGDGNHAEGVAYAAHCLKIPTSIVIPLGLPASRHNTLSRLGVSVVFSGTDSDAAMKEARRMERQHDLAPIPALDDPYVIAGQGTVGMEILRQIPPHRLEVVFCAILNGALIAGVGVYIKRIAPHVKIVGVVSVDTSPMVQSLMHDKQMKCAASGSTQGRRMFTVEGETLRLCQEVLDEIEVVTFDDTCAAIKDIFEETRVVVEPNGALALAGLKKWVNRNASQRGKHVLVAITAGGRADFDHLNSIAERIPPS